MDKMPLLSSYYDSICSNYLVKFICLCSFQFERDYGGHGTEKTHGNLPKNVFASAIYLQTLEFMKFYKLNRCFLFKKTQGKG